MLTPGTKLVFDQEQEGLFETFGVSDDVAQKIMARFALFNEEVEREAKAKLKKALGDSYDEVIDKASDGDEKARAQVEEIVGDIFTWTGVLEGFLSSSLFEDLKFEPKSVNDYFVLGIIFDRVFMKKKMGKGMSQMVGLVKEMVEA